MSTLKQKTWPGLFVGEEKNQMCREKNYQSENINSNQVFWFTFIEKLFNQAKIAIFSKHSFCFRCCTVCSQDWSKSHRQGQTVFLCQFYPHLFRWSNCRAGYTWRENMTWSFCSSFNLSILSIACVLYNQRKMWCMHKFLETRELSTFSWLIWDAAPVQTHCKVQTTLIRISYKECFWPTKKLGYC